MTPAPTTFDQPTERSQPWQTLLPLDVVLTVNSVALGLGLVLGWRRRRRSMRAADPDIPRLQVDAERGSVRQQLELGSAYFAGRGVPQDEKRAAYWFEKAANAGDPGAQAQIGYFYEAGIGVSRDPAQAARWFQRAVAGGLISAKVNLGVAYLLGEGVKQDTAMAEDLFRRAFAQGNGMAACYLGEMYSLGTGVERDEAAGERWYEAGVKLHDARARIPAREPSLEAAEERRRSEAVGQALSRIGRRRAWSRPSISSA